MSADIKIGHPPFFLELMIYRQEKCLFTFFFLPMYDEDEEGATHVENRKSRCRKFDDFEDVQQTGLISFVLTSKIHFVSPHNQQKNLCGCNAV